MKSPKLEQTPYGFRYGAALVQRIASHDGYVVIGIDAGKTRVEVVVSPAGRSVKTRTVKQ